MEGVNKAAYNSLYFHPHPPHTFHGTPPFRLQLWPHIRHDIGTSCQIYSQVMSFEYSHCYYAASTNWTRSGFPQPHLSKVSQSMTQPWTKGDHIPMLSNQMPVQHNGMPAHLFTAKCRSVSKSQVKMTTCLLGAIFLLKKALENISNTLKFAIHVLKLLIKGWILCYSNIFLWSTPFRWLIIQF